ncbi:hypothetical protein OU5_1668 [Pseudomonas mandelii JR-1]|uniref:Uncharacterized protein n=1 Tax=Pseudomonas mandelii JR-1 TaxID=1147786 RepID=A0A024E7J7_9PSED|nr:hypothetical protein OU5_1668 [Pseudomonas mandelii JR-1]
MFAALPLAALAQHNGSNRLNGVSVKNREHFDRSLKLTAISVSSRKADYKAWIETRLFTWITTRI